MEVRPGYKQTELGVIPVEWKVRSLGNLKPFVTSGSRGWAAFYSDRGSLFVRITNMSRDSIYLDLENPKFVNLPAESSEGIRTQLQEHDVLISITADIGIVSYVDPRVPIPAYINQHIALVRFDQARTCGKFVSYFLASEKPQRLFRASTDTGAKAGMSLPMVQKIEVALPPLPEQRAIAAALSDVDALLGGLERLIAKKRDLKQAAMQQLLTGSTRLPGFSREWEVKRLGETCRITTGRKDVNEGNPDGQFPFFTCSRSHTFSHSYSFDTEAILIAGNGEVGNLHYFNGKFEAYQRTYVLYDFSVQVSYLWQQLNANLAESLGLGKIGSSIPYIKKANLTEFEFGSPKDGDEQTAIAAVLSDMDAELSALVARRDKTRDLKQAMMQELLTGRIRLV